MVIYEVNLFVNSEIYSQFKTWLKKHVGEMLQFPGFIQANILKPEAEKNSEQELITVQYQLTSRKDLETYFEKYASQMRGEGISLFADKFRAERKIYQVQETLSK